MKSPEQCTSMADIRAAIDSVDKQIVALIGQRAGYVRAAAGFKSSEQAVRDPARVQEVIAGKRALAGQAGVSADLIEAVYRTMINAFIEEEMKEWGGS